MAVTTNQRRPLLALVAGLAAAAALCSCSAGWNTQTGSQLAAIDGTSINSDLDGVGVRNAYIAVSGQEGSLSFVAVNPSIRLVRLSSVTVVYPSGKRQNLSALANKDIPAQGRLQVGPVPADASGIARADFAPSPSLDMAGEQLAPGLSVKIEFNVVAPPSHDPDFPQEKRTSFQGPVPIIGKGESPAKKD
ncbi:hypothetical protein Srot_0444 [Segniliparus rotundus DSM 44985]|uniref:Lipoprotein n=1 Tax=Segniliparus rotundus (strain ATCC BAA-972 / CDC 1076 / CIP 108378 / DSM 44985 / JCM 13578) TaxID=640132 RepID=D6ZBV4_SEGRD|nr:hypothetical protein [Segniliparus rotundus]ADG96931.1 hypothetical protein Srot_0444 [Segniliparus rotundus DSM 44985]